MAPHSKIQTLPNWYESRTIMCLLYWWTKPYLRLVWRVLLSQQRWVESLLLDRSKRNVLKVLFLTCKIQKQYRMMGLRCLENKQSKEDTFVRRPQEDLKSQTNSARHQHTFWILVTYSILNISAIIDKVASWLHDFSSLCHGTKKPTGKVHEKNKKRWSPDRPLSSTRPQTASLRTAPTLRSTNDQSQAHILSIRNARGRHAVGGCGSNPPRFCLLKSLSGWVCWGFPEFLKGFVRFYQRFF